MEIASTGKFLISCKDYPETQLRLFCLCLTQKYEKAEEKKKWNKLLGNMNSESNAHAARQHINLNNYSLKTNIGYFISKRKRAEWPVLMMTQVKTGLFDPTKKFFFFFLRQLTKITGNLWPSLGHRPWKLHFRKVDVIRCWSTLHFRYRRGDFLRSWLSGGGYTVLARRSPGREILGNVSVDIVFLERPLCRAQTRPQLVSCSSHFSPLLA